MIWIMQSLANGDMHVFVVLLNFFFTKFTFSLNINQLNFRFYIERIQKRNESVAPSPRS